MSEVEKHYGGDADQLERARERTIGKQPTSRAKGDQSPLDRAEETLKEARDSATRAAERVKGSVTDGYERAQDWAQDSYDTVSRNAVYARRRSAAELKRGRRGVETFVEENPIMVGVAGIAAGLLIGALLPATRRENQLLGPYADDVRREGVRYAKDVAQQGREALSENLRAMAPGLDPERR